jgi:hypothetical protein
MASRVEILFAKLSSFRRIATRYEKLCHTFAAFGSGGWISLWLKYQPPLPHTLEYFDNVTMRHLDAVSLRVTKARCRDARNLRWIPA